MTTLIDYLHRNAELQPEKLACWVEGRELTHGQLLQQVLMVAANLKRHIQGKGDRCLICLDTGPEQVLAIYASQLLGAIPVILNAALPAFTTSRRAARVESNLVVTSANRMTELKRELESHRPAAKVIAVEEITEPGRGDCMPESLPAPDDIAYLQFTSGTTGEPKAAIIKYKHLTAYFEAALENLGGLREDDVLVSWVPFYHDMGLVRFLFGSLWFGRPLYQLEPSMRGIKRWIKLMSDVKCTITGAPDFGYRLAARFSNPEEVDLGSLRYCSNGGEAVRTSTVDLFEEKFNVPGVIMPNYGLAEATLGATVHHIDERRRTDKNGTLSCGKALGDLRIRITDEFGNELPTGEPGEICLKGSTIISGYFNDESATRSALRDGWLFTGDTGYLDKDAYLFVYGRKKAMIKRGGSVIIPREIEEIVDQTEGIRFSAVMGLPSKTDTGLEDVIIIAEINSEAADTREELTSEISQKSRSVIGFDPVEILLVPAGSIPRTGNGKIQYEELQRKYLKGTLLIGPKEKNSSPAVRG